MAQQMEDFIADLRRTVQRWKQELATAESEGVGEVAQAIRAWIEEGERVIADSGY